MSEIDDLATALKAEPRLAATADGINETLACVSGAFDVVCGRDTAWLAELHQALPDLPPSEARFIALILIADKCRLIHERAVDLLVAERNADPSLQNLIDELQSEGQR
jgi:hypothetical protein